MKRSFTSTLVLAAVLAGLVAWYLVYEKKMRPQAKEAEEKTKQLFTLDQNAIQEITIQRQIAPPAGAKPPSTPQYETIQLKKTGTDWALTQPVDYPADGGVVSSMVSTLTTTKQERVVEEKPKDLEPFGLVNPKVKVSARKDAASPAEEISIGSDTPVGFSNYAKVTGAEVVYRVPRTLLTTFDKDAKTLRNKSILTIPRFELGEVEIQNGGENLVLKKGEKDEWTLARENLPADTNEWNKTLTSLVDMKATEFAADKTPRLGDFGLSPPQIKARLVKAKDQAKTEVWLGKTKKGYFAKLADKDTVFEITKENFDNIARPASAYRDLRLASFNRFDVKRVKFEREGNSFELVKNNADWSFAADPATKVDNTKVDGLLTGLQDARIAKYLPASATVKKAELTLSLYETTDEKAAEKIQLKFAGAKGKSITTERKGLPLPFTVSEADWKRFNLSKSDFTQTAPKTAPEANQAPKPPGATEPQLMDGKSS